MSCPHAPPGPALRAGKRHLGWSWVWPYRVFPVLTFHEELPGGGGEAGAIDAVVAEDFLLASGHGVIIGEADDFKPGQEAFLKQQSGAGFAQAAVDAVLLHRDQSAGLS